MVKTQEKPVYNSYGNKDMAISKKEQFAFKGQDRKDITKSAAEKNPDPWGKTFKNEKHFKSMHIC